MIFLIAFFGFWQSGYFFSQKDANQVPPVANKEETVSEPAPEPIVELAPEETQPISVEPLVKRDPLTMPFIVQAPNAEWDNPLFENACEEASLLMVASLFRGATSMSQVESRKELLALAAYQKKKLGHSVDTSITDTNKILEEYFDIEGRVMEMSNEQEMKELVSEGSILIIPADGQKLSNPFFTPPGPINHMLVVLKYDEKTGEYITHDPGTRRGAFYHYQPDVLWKAIRDYPTGATHVPNTKKDKRILVVPLER